MEKSFSVGTILPELNEDARVTMLGTHKRMLLLRSELEKRNIVQQVEEQVESRPAWAVVTPDGTCDVFSSYTSAWKHNKRLIDMGHVLYFADTSSTATNNHTSPRVTSEGDEQPHKET